MTKFEKIYLGVFCCTLLWGLWHALPQTSVVADESTFVGAVLRAMEARTLVPDIEASYTLSFYASYVLMVPVVMWALAVSGLSALGAAAWLGDHYALLYLVPRFVSVLASVGITYLLLRLMREEGLCLRDRLLCTTLALTPIIVVAIMHTGKMWALSALLVLWATYLCARIVRGEASGPWYYSPLFWLPGAAALSVANFPLAIVVAAPWAYALWLVRKDTERLALFIKASLLWAVVGAGLIAVNLHGWVSQSAATPMEAFVPLEATGWQLLLLPAMLPGLFFALLLHADRIQNRALALVIGLELAAYILLVALRAPWVAASVDYLRYYFLVAILMGALLACVSVGRQKILYALACVSLLFFGKTLYLLGMPTTYNQAHDWVVKTVAGREVVLKNTVSVLDLPRTAKAYAMLKDGLCASKCEQELARPTSPYRYTLISNETDPKKAEGLVPDYFVSSSSADGTLMFGRAGDYYAMNHRLGLYNPRYLALERLGEPIYVAER